MTVQTATDVTRIEPIRRDTDARLRATQAYELLLTQLESLGPDDWQTVTPCAPWTVADLVGHLIGAARGHASVRELLRQVVYGYRHRGAFDGNAMDAFNDLQVRDHADLTPNERVAAIRELAPRAVAGRMRLPGPLRGLKLPIDQGGSVAAGMPGHVELGHLLDAVLTRDVWLHRVDIAQATGRPLDVDTDLDRRVVADVVREWAGRHGQPFVLTLGGPAGGRFRQGDGGAQLALDAIAFCQALSGRAPADGLLATRVLF